MPFDEDLAERVRGLLDAEPVTERRMFGGLAFLVGGNLAIAASGQGGLMVRVDPRQTEELVRAAGVSRMVMRGKEMDGWLRVDPDVVSADSELARWVQVGAAYAATLPAK